LAPNVLPTKLRQDTWTLARNLGTASMATLFFGMAEGAFPGGFPYDDAREERLDENFQETLYLPVTPADY
jgi:hypothetical protein